MDIIKLLITLTSLFFLNISFAQKRDTFHEQRQLRYLEAINDSTNQEYWFNYLKDSSENLLALNCGLGGNRTTVNSYYIRHLINAGRYDLITKLLSSKLSTTRYLAALSLIFADEKSIFTLDSITYLRIVSLRNDITPVPCCSGCIYGLPLISFRTLYVKTPKMNERKRRKTFNWIESKLYNSAESVFWTD